MAKSSSRKYSTDFATSGALKYGAWSVKIKEKGGDIMTDYYYKEESTDTQTNPFKIALLGALAGAVGTGVALVLSNPKNRQKIQKTMQDGQKWMDKTVGELKTDASDMAEKTSETARKMGNRMEKPINDLTKEPKTIHPMK